MLDMDAYFIPHELLCAKFADNGVDTARVVPSGIPYPSAFFKNQRNFPAVS